VRTLLYPRINPDWTDYECELGVIIGKTAKGVSEAEALDYVAGYTVLNDISDRKYQPNPERKERPRDVFFDWMHGKWHDGFCPMGPAVTSAAAIGDPQDLDSAPHRKRGRTPAQQHKPHDLPDRCGH
jgi:2,4-diketo-3-deoxy-L-fuconate hydrolase